jgi:hypothetical protein
MQMKAAGTAIMKLKEIAFALSFNPTLLICFTKKTNASYKGTP